MIIINKYVTILFELSTPTNGRELYIYSKDWMNDVPKRFKSGQFILSRHNTRTQHKGTIDVVRVRRLSLRGKRVVFKLAVTEYRNFLGNLSRLRNDVITFKYDKRNMDYVEHPDGVLEIVSDVQRLVLFPAGYYQPNEWHLWYSMSSPPSMLNK